jgi:predicted flap endonuclease-1-like 5' DNA nuclease
MMLSFILLQSTLQQDLPVGLALCIVPFILGYLFAYLYHKVGTLSSTIKELNENVSRLTNENTDVRVKLTQAEAQSDYLNEQLRKAKNDLILCESERNMLKEQAGVGVQAHPASVTFAGTKYKWNDLKIVEGIGPKIADLFNDAGINTWDELAASSADKLRSILDAAGSNFNIHDPGTWPEQARLAAASDWDALKKLQDELNAGK